MILPLFFAAARAYHSTTYIGNYATNITFQNGTRVFEKAPLTFTHGSILSPNYNASEGIQLVMEFTDGNFLKIGTLSLVGEGPDSNNTYFFYGIFPAGRRPLLVSLLAAVKKKLSDANGPGNYTYMDIYAELFQLFSSRGVTVQAAIFSVEGSRRPSGNATFLLDEKASGVFLMDRDSMRIDGYVFDEEGYVSEGKVFGVVASVGVLLLYWAWISLSKWFGSMSHLSQLSLHSYIMHMAFDHSYTAFLFNLGRLNWRLATLYTVLWVLMLPLAFILEMYQVMMIWKASLDTGGDVNEGQEREKFMDMCFELTAVLFVMYTAASVVFEAPIIGITVLYLYFVPQIVHSARSPIRKTRDTVFNIITSVVRLMPVYYFTLYSRNIKHTHSVPVAIYATCLVGVQLVIVTLQNIFGGAFFLAKRMRPQLFDYRAERPEPGTDCAICMSPIGETDPVMTTPCHHSFHEECLSRWMEEQMVCPICRARLPGGSTENAENPQPNTEDAPMYL